MDSASLLMIDDTMNDENALFEGGVDELPASSVQELPLIKDCAVQLATIARGSLFNCHKWNYKLRISNCQLLGQLTEQEILQTQPHC